MNSRTDLEQVILGTFLIDEASHAYIDVISLKMLSIQAHRVILTVFHDMKKEGKAIDLLTVSQYMRSKGLIDQIGGSYYLSELTNRIASSANIEQHVLILKNEWLKSEIFASIVAISSENENDSLEISDRIKAKLDELEAEFREGFSYNYQPQDRLYTEAIEYINEAKQRHDSGKPMQGKDTNIPSLNSLIGNLQGGELTIIGARPAMGKTMTMLQIAQNTTQYPVIIFSLEMSSRALMIRQISKETEIEYRDLQSGNFGKSIDQLIKESEFIAKNKIIIDDTSALTCSQLERVCKIVHKTHGGIAAVLVDYLDIVENHEKEIRHKVSHTARTLKRIAKDLNTPVVCLAQLSRELAKRNDKRPILSDIRESGKVEEEADLILFLHRPAYYDHEAVDESGNDISDLLEIIVAKNRNGNLGTAKASIDLKYGKFNDFKEYRQYSNYLPNSRIEIDRDAF